MDKHKGGQDRTNGSSRQLRVSIARQPVHAQWYLCAGVQASSRQTGDERGDGQDRLTVRPDHCASAVRGVASGECGMQCGCRVWGAGRVRSWCQRTKRALLHGACWFSEISDFTVSAPFTTIVHVVDQYDRSRHVEVW